MVHTSVAKSSALPADPGLLLGGMVWHPSERLNRSLWYRLRGFLCPEYLWSAGSPEEQRVRHAEEERVRAQLNWSPEVGLGPVL